MRVARPHVVRSARGLDPVLVSEVKRRRGLSEQALAIFFVTIVEFCEDLRVLSSR